MASYLAPFLKILVRSCRGFSGEDSEVLGLNPTDVLSERRGH